MSEDAGLGKRIATRIPTHMPELQRELDKFPEQYQSKRLLNLANMGLLVAQNETISALVAHLVRVTMEDGAVLAQTPAAVASVQVAPSGEALPRQQASPPDSSPNDEASTNDPQAPAEPAEQSVVKPVRPKRMPTPGAGMM